MSTQKIAITVPPPFLKRVDQWAKKTGKSRSRFIVEELDNRLKTLEDEEITRIYNRAYDNDEAVKEDIEMGEEMLNMSAIHEEEEK